MTQNVNFKIIPVTHYKQNACIVWQDGCNKAAVIDPGGEVEKITSFIEGVVA
ncbi:hypothetical protein [Shewanella algae]|uniref:hypothetical protein n=1 Tax=Shewanella algae TaxID=38313 RepID=UPI0030045EF7